MKILKKNRGALLLAVILLGGLLFVTNPNAASLADVPKQESFIVHGVTGTVEFKGGRSNTGTDFVGSWANDGSSETVTLSGFTKASGLGSSSPTKAKYVLYMDGVKQQEWYHNATGGTSLISGNGVQLTPQTWYFKGPTRGDHVLKVDLQVYHKRSTFSEHEWITIATDGARLLDGAGSIKLDGQTDRFAEGETATFRVVTGNGGPWKVEVFDGTGVLMCGAYTPALQTAFTGRGYIGSTKPQPQRCTSLEFAGRFDGKVKLTIPEKSFRADGKNEWKIKLSNANWPHAEERLFTIDNSKLAPEVPTVSESPSAPKVGEQVTLKMSARMNPLSNSPIKKFVVTAWYGARDAIPANSDDLIVSSHEVQAKADGSKFVGEYKFTPTTAAKVSYRVVAFDAAGRPSGSVINSEQIRELEEAGMPDPNGSGRGVVDTVGAPETAAGLGEAAAPQTSFNYGLGGALAIAIGALAYTFIPGRPLLRGGLGIGIAGAVFYAVGRLFG